jgi:hypothetical protein
VNDAADGVNAHRIAALETGLAEQRALLTAGFERISAKMDALIEIKVRHERTDRDLEQAWAVIHQHEQLIGSLRELPGMKVTLFGQDGQGGLVARVMAAEAVARSLDGRVGSAVEGNDDRLDAIERMLEGANDTPGLQTRVDRLEQDGRLYRRVLKLGGAAMGALVIWLATNLGDKLKAIFFHGP